MGDFLQFLSQNRSGQDVDPLDFAYSHLALQKINYDIIRPHLPSKQLISDLRSQVDEEINSLKMEIHGLKSVYNSLSEENFHNPYNPRSLGIMSYRGFLINHPLIDQIIDHNKNKINLAQKKSFIAPLRTTDQSQVYHQIASMCRQLTVFVPYLFQLVFKRKQMQQEKELYLTAVYMAVRSEWKVLCHYVDILNIRTHISSNEWGYEQSCSPSIRDAGGEAPDVPMLLDYTRESSILCDYNNFVDDPYKEHIAFKKRLVWTDNEVKTFYDKYFSYPKKFKKIATYLQCKATKDVIEFYYTHKSTPQMINIFARLKNSGKRSTKVVTEGKVKTGK